MNVNVLLLPGFALHGSRLMNFDRDPNAFPVTQDLFEHSNGQPGRRNTERELRSTAATYCYANSKVIRSHSSPQASESCWMKTHKLKIDNSNEIINSKWWVMACFVEVVGLGVLVWCI